MKTKKQKIIFKKGFSLGEVLLALFVLAFGIITSVYLMSGSLKDTMKSRDLLVAAMLSQEGTELIRNIRDNNVTEKNPSTGRRNKPFEGIPNSGQCAVDYYFDPDTGNNNSSFLNSLDCGSADYNLYFRDDGAGNLFYSHSGGDPTKFKRKIIIGFEGEGKRSIKSMVIWDRENFPSVEECSIGQNCTFSETILTEWINIE